MLELNFFLSKSMMLKQRVSFAHSHYRLSKWIFIIKEIISIQTLLTKIIFHKERGDLSKCPGDLIYTECSGGCGLICVDGELNHENAMNCLIDVCLSGCNCPSGRHRVGDKCRKNEECLPIPKGNMLKLNKMVSLFYPIRNTFVIKHLIPLI